MTISPNLTIRQLEQLLLLHKRKEELLAELTSLDGEIAGALSGDGLPAPKRRGRPPGRASSRAATVKTRRTAKAGKAAGAGKTRRGGLKEKILGRLQSVGPEGIKVRDLAQDLGVNRKNVEIWFYTTGKKLSEIKKLGPGLFTMSGKAAASKPAPRGRKPKKETRRAKAGSTRERVMAELQAAGEAGISVKELSAKLGMKAQNLHTWFNQTGKKIAEVTKVSLGRYRMAAV